MAGTKAALLVATALWSTLTGAQRAGTSIPEHHPKLTTSKCTLKGGCRTQNTAVVIDQLSRNTHLEGHADISCGTWEGLNTTVCPDAKTCFKNCVMEGVDYAAHGVTTKGDALTLNMFMPGADGTPSSVSPRVYLLDEGESKYADLKLLNRELAYDADVSKLVCGMNGALYLSEMDMSGGQGPLNTAGAAYGTGYCDAQCFSIPWINGVVSNATVTARRPPQTRAV
jgi:cellulase